MGKEVKIDVGYKDVLAKERNGLKLFWSKIPCQFKVSISSEISNIGLAQRARFITPSSTNVFSVRVKVVLVPTFSQDLIC